ncbi:MAG TPA: (Fe-S)-binding protein [Bacteroidales bacterium]|nr:(Fe-S)-binding protein [Bacteroidales bacterium]
MKDFDPFVIPFNVGLYFILIYSVVRCVIWFRQLSRADKLRLQRGFFSRAFGESLREIFMESLIHRKILKAKPVLGYMHMSLAFGWFLLIVFGTLEADIFGKSHLNPPYKAIFFRFFNPGHGDSLLAEIWEFIMDLLLAFILSGLLLAIVKRFLPGVVGMKKTTKLRLHDKIALTALWLVFPSRLIAESLTCGANGSGSFLTGTTGAWLASFLPAESLAYPFWWLYSLSLGVFFILLPVTRYMHIPTELFLIFMRNSGITTGDKAGTFAEVEVHSCSSCGMCIDACQMSFVTGINNIQPVYLHRALRNNEDVTEKAYNCLMCGRCEEACPVGIEVSAVRMIQRRNKTGKPLYENRWMGYFREHLNHEPASSGKTQNYKIRSNIRVEKADTIYFAGCMTHLTPGIKEAMIKIFRAANEKVWFMDEVEGACCGRPLMLAGNDREARELINFNSDLIWKSGASKLVTSCPICYNIFRSSYYIDTEILHHSQYIKNLIDNEAIRFNYSHKKVVYHDPCELGRVAGIYEEPRDVVSWVADLVSVPEEAEKSLCCGNSLANIFLPPSKKNAIAVDAIKRLTAGNPDIVATSCPLCKKTFSRVSKTRVADIAEIVAEEISSVQSKRIRTASVNLREMVNQLLG